MSDKNFIKFNLQRFSEPSLSQDASGAYLITSVADMQTLAEYVNAGNDCAGLTFKLANNIDFQNEENYTPIGTFTNCFKGTFYGNGNKISNINCSSSDNYVGLFGFADNATIQDLNLENCTFTSTVSNEVANIYIGSIFGVNYGGEFDVNNSSQIINCHVKGGNVSAAGTCHSTCIGGIVGENYSGTIENCSYEGTVSDSATATLGHDVGGIVGFNYGSTVTDSVAQASVKCESIYGQSKNVGGIAGYNGYSSTISNNVFVSKSEGLSGGSGGNNYIGAITGHNQKSTLLNNFYAKTEIKGIGYAQKSEEEYETNIDNGTEQAPAITLTLPEGVEVTGAVYTDGKIYFAKGATVTLTGFTEDKTITFGEGVTLEKSGNDVIVKTGGETAFTITGLTTKDYTPDNTGYTYSDGTYTYALAGTDSSITIDNHTLTHTAGNVGENIFSIVGVNANVNLVNPSVDGNGKYTITLPASSYLTDGKTVTINKLNDEVNGATIKFAVSGSGCNVTANFVATVETGAISNITVNEKLYTSLGSVLEIKTTADGDSSLFAGTIIVTDEQEGVKVISGNGVNVTVTSGAVTSITNLNAGNKVEYNGKTYTVIQYGRYIFDGTTYYRRLNADLLKLEESAITNIAVTNGVINFPENIAEDTVFVGENDKLVATYYSDTLYITGSGNYTVKTSSDVKISAGGNRIYKPISGGEIEISATSSSSSLSKGTVQLSSGSVNVDGQTIELIGGDGITVTADNGTVTSFGGLNSGDRFDAGDYIYTVKDKGILKEGPPLIGADDKKYIHSAATNFTLADQNWTQAEIVHDYQGIKFLDLTGENISYIDENYNVIASYSEQNGLTAAAGYTVPDNLYVDILPEGTFTIAKEFKNFMLFLSSDELPYEITTKSDADNYSVTSQIKYDEDPDPIYAYILDTSNISAVTLTENGQTYTYNFEDGAATFTESGNTYKQAITDNRIDFNQLMPSAMMTPLNIESNWELYNGTVTVTNSEPLKIYGGKTLTITEDNIYYPVTATVENGVLKSVSRSSRTGSTEFTYNGNTLYVAGAFTANFDDNCNLTAISSEFGAVFSYNNKGLSADGAFTANFDDNGGWSVTTSDNITCNGYELKISGGEVTANYDSNRMLQTVSGIGAGEKVQNLNNGSGSGVALEVTAGEISATYSKYRGGMWNIFGDLNSGDKFVTFATEYTVLANGMLGENGSNYYYCQVDNGTAKTENEQRAFLVSNIQGTEFLYIDNVNAVYVKDDTAKIVAEMNNNTLTAKDDSAANLYVDVSGLYSAGTYTIDDTFKYISAYGVIHLEVTATDDYTFTNDGGKLYLNTANITRLTSQNVTFNKDSEDFTYTFGDGVATKTSTSSGGNIYKQAITDNRIDFNQLMPSAIMTGYSIENNWGLYNGEVTVTNSEPLKIYGGKTLTVADGEVSAKVENGVLKQVSSDSAAEFTYNEKTLDVNREFTATYSNGILSTVETSGDVTYNNKTLDTHNSENNTVAYDANGNLSSVTVKNNGENYAELTYNDKTLLISETTDSSTPAEITATYSNDVLQSVSGIDANEYITYSDGKELKVTAGTISATYDASGNLVSFGDLNVGDKFEIRIGNVVDYYEVFESTIVKTQLDGKEFVQTLAESTASVNENWLAANIVTQDYLYLAKNTTYIDATGKILAQVDDKGSLTKKDNAATDLFISFLEDGTYTIPAEFKNISLYPLPAEVTATGDYTLTRNDEVKTINVANVTKITANNSSEAEFIEQMIEIYQKILNSLTDEDIANLDEIRQAKLDQMQAMVEEGEEQIEYYRNLPDSVITFDTDKTVATNTEGNNVWKQAIDESKECSYSAITSTYSGEHNWSLYNGTATVTNVAPLKIYGEGEVTISGGKDAEGKDIPAEVTATVANGKLTNITGIGAGETVTYNGKTLSVSSGEISATYENGELKSVSGLSAGASVTYNGKTLSVSSGEISATYENGELKSVSGLSAGASVTYDGKTYSHTITLPSGVTADGDKLTIDGKTYYADGSTVAISNFGAGKEITFDSAITSVEVSGNNIIAKVGDDTALTLSGLTLSNSVPATWQVSGASASYGTACTVAGARINGKKIVYQQTGYTADFTLSNLANNITLDKVQSAVEVNEQTVTVKSAEILDEAKTATISAGYTLKLDDSLKTNIKDPTWTQNEYNKARYVYTVSGNVGGFTDVGNKIYYATSTLPTITMVGLKDNLATDGKTLPDGINIEKQADNSYKITFSSADVFDGTKIPTFIADNRITYTLEVADELKPALQAPAWRKAEYTKVISSDVSAGYKVENNKLVYVEKEKGEPIFEITGTIQLDTAPMPKDGVLTFDAADVGSVTSIVRNPENYAIKLTGNMAGKTFNSTGYADKLTVDANNMLIKSYGGDDEILVNGENVSIAAGGGDDEITLGENASGANIIFDKDSGNITVKNYREDTKITISVPKEGYEPPKNDGDNVVIKVGRAILTLENAKNNFSSDDIVEVYDTSAFPTGVFANTPPTLQIGSTFEGTEIKLDDYPQTFTNIGAGYVTQDLKIVGTVLNNNIESGTGNDTIDGGIGDDSLSGGEGNDILIGNDGNDTLRGGAGNDIFIYDSGNDVISDYIPGEDKIKLNFSDIESSTLVGTGNLTLTIKDNKGTLKIYNQYNNISSITFVDDNGKTTDKVFFEDVSYDPLPEGLTYSSNRKQLQILSSFTGNEISDYLDKVENITSYYVISRNLNIVGNANNNKIELKTAGNDTISGGDGNDTLSGYNGDDSIMGDAGNDILKGEAGNDTLNGGAGKNTLTGGDGNDVFVYGGGNDVITDYKQGKDQINFNTTKIKNVACEGKNVIITTDDNGTLTINSAKDSLVTFVNDAGAVTKQLYFYNDMYYEPLEAGLSYNSTKTTLTLTSAFAGSTIDLNKYLKTAKDFYTTVNKPLIITGSTKDNSIKAGAGNDVIYGGDGNDTINGSSGADSIFGDAGDDSLKGDGGNDTLNGGSGNDTLTGGTGNDVFIYEGGNDVITDYAATDSIQIKNGTVTNTAVNGNDVVFTIGDGSLTVQNGKSKKITVTDSSNSTATQTYSREINWLYDSNFMEEDTTLDEITEQKYSVTEIQNPDNENIAQDQTILTYGEDK